MFIQGVFFNWWLRPPKSSKCQNLPFSKNKKTREILNENAGDCLQRKFVKYVLSLTIDTLHKQVALYTGGSQLEWREVESGKLPSPRRGLRASLVDNTIFVAGGWDYDKTSILSWDPASESWQPAGDLKVGRGFHAAVAIPSSIVESECSAKLLT